MRVVIALLTLGGLLGCFGVPVAEAQRSSERRRELLEGVLRTFIDSRMERQQTEKPPEPERKPPGQKPASPRKHSHGRGPGHSSELVRTAEAFAAETNELVSALYQEARVNSGIRPLLAGALRLRGDATLFVQRAQQFRDEQSLTESAQSLDQQWRVLAHQLRQTPRLDANLLARVDRLNAHNQRLGQILGIAPQIDYGQAMFQTVALVTNLANLLDDVAVDVPDPRRRSELLMEGHKVQVEMTRLAEQLGERVVQPDPANRYKQAYALWRALAAKARPLSSESMARNIRRIDQLNREIHEQFWLPMAVDRAEVTHLAEVLSQQVSQFCGELSVDMLLETPNPGEAMAAVRELRDVCRSFAKSAASKATLEDLLWDFRLVQVQWDETQKQWQPAKVTMLEPQLSEIDSALVALRDSMQIRPVVDRGHAVALAAAVDESAAMLDRYLRQKIGRSSRYSSQFRSQILGRSQTFHEASHRLHEGLVENIDDDTLRGQCTSAAERWNLLADSLGKLDSRDRAACADTYEEIAPTLAELQVLLTY